MIDGAERTPSCRHRELLRGYQHHRCWGSLAPSRCTATQFPQPLGAHRFAALMMDSTLPFLPGDKAAELLLLGLYFCHLPLLCHALSHNVPTATGTAPEPPMSPTLVVVSFQLWPISLASRRCRLPSLWPGKHPRRLSAPTIASLGQLHATASRPADGRVSRPARRGPLPFTWVPR